MKLSIDDNQSEDLVETAISSGFKRANMSVTRRGAMTSVIGDYVVVVGGYDGKQHMASGEKLSLLTGTISLISFVLFIPRLSSVFFLTGTWSPITPMPTARSCGAACVLGGK